MTLTSAQRRLLAWLDGDAPPPPPEAMELLRASHRAECAPPLPPDCPRPLGEPHHADTSHF